jgi:type IV secretion system protein TrbF
MIFSRNEPANYLTSRPLETPFNRARAELDGLLGSATVRAANWRFAFFSSMAITFLLTVMVLYQITSRKVIPVIVGIDKERGEPVLIGDASQIIHQPGEQEIKYFLSHFIRDVRSIPSDPVVLKQNWLRAYSFLRKSAATLLNNITNDEKTGPFSRVGELTLIPQLLSVTQIPGSAAYQAHWKESLYNKEGQKLDEYLMLGTFSIEIEPPSDYQTLSENPLGIYISNFQWNRELKE